jgi:hypothetical protein
MVIYIDEYLARRRGTAVSAQAYSAATGDGRTKAMREVRAAEFRDPRHARGPRKDPVDPICSASTVALEALFAEASLV